MKTLHLTTWERTSLAGFIAQQRGDLAQLRRFMRLLDILELDDEDRAAVGWKETENGQAAWVEAEHEFELEFEDADFDLLAKTALPFNGWPANRLVVTMLDKIEAAKTS